MSDVILPPTNEGWDGPTITSRMRRAITAALRGPWGGPHTLHGRRQRWLVAYILADPGVRCGGVRYRNGEIGKFLGLSEAAAAQHVKRGYELYHGSWGQLPTDKELVEAEHRAAELMGYRCKHPERFAWDWSL